MNLPSIPPWMEAIIRAIQFIAALISLVLWGIYLSNISVGNRASSLHAVLGILVTGTVWAITASGSTAWKQRQANRKRDRWGKAIALVLAVAVVDFCFICLFAAVAGITGPSARNKGSACVLDEDNEDNDASNNTTLYRNGCSYNKGVLGLAILNVFTFSGSSLINALQSTQNPPNPKKLAQGPVSMSNIKGSTV